MDVVIVGAGPTGLATACGLRAAGVDVLVVDKAPSPASTSRALGLQPRGAEVLDRLGALGELPGRCLPIRQVVVSVDSRELSRLRVGMTTPLVKRPGLLVAQTEIEDALRRRFAELGGRVEWGRAVSGLEPDSTGVTLHTAAGALRADWVVGADGAHSAVRRAAGIGFPGVPLVERFLLADVDADLGLPRDAVAVWLRGDEMLGAFPLPDDGAQRRWRLMAPSAAPVTDVRAALVAMLESHTGRTSAVGDAVWTSEFAIHRRLADTYRRGRVMLAGDAAHVHSPFGGQGLNTGIGDAENLAWKLALVVHGRAGAALLDTYGAERRPVAAEVLAATSGLTGAMLGRSTVARLLRDHVVVPLLNRPVVQRFAWERASQLLVSYRGGPLAPRSWPARGPRPGDRVPDLACRTPDGEAMSLHAALGPSWVVLAPGVAGARVDAGVDACVDVARAALGPLVAELRGDGRDVLLVRPDAHLLWRGRSAAGLRASLDGVLGAAAVRPVG
ncbi:MAG: FAD-dependent oxidoreductase [Pseudonocardia sp.]